jgi:hypothetical protein
MKIEFPSVDADRVLDAKGPQVDFAFEDQGTANVVMLLSLDDGTQLSYPTGGGKSDVQSTTLAPRVYLGALTIVAMELKTFGRRYKSKVTVGGKILATAVGQVPEGEPTDQRTEVFQLRVKK